MQIYIVSRGNLERMLTPALLDKADIQYTVVVDTYEQARDVRKTTEGATLVCPFSDLVQKRNWITKQHLKLKDSPIYIGMDDNIQEFTAVDHHYYDNDKLPTDDHTNWRPRYNAVCDTSLYVEHLMSLVHEMKRVGAPYGGVATMENPFFRARKYSYRRFVKTKVFVMDASAGLTFKHSMCHDSFVTAQAIAMYGKVVVNSFLFYKAAWYQKGGLGDRKAREDAGLLDQLQACVDEFPGLVALAHGSNSALRVLKCNDSGVERWRREHGYLTVSS